MATGTYTDATGESIDVSPYDTIDVVVEAPRGEDGSNAGGDDASEAGEEGGYVSAQLDTTPFSSLTVYAANARSSNAGDGGAGGSNSDGADGAGGDGGGASAIQAGDGTWLVGAGGGGGGGGDGDDGFSGADGCGGGGGAWGGVGGTSDAFEGDGSDGASGPTTTGGDGGDVDSLDGDPVGNAGEGQGWVNATYTSNVTTTTGGSSFGHAQSEVEVTSVTWDVTARPNLSATVVNGTTIDLAWDDVADSAEELRVYRSTAAGVDNTDSLVATLGPNETSYSDVGLEEGVTYHYTVAAYASANGDETFEYSSEVSATTFLPAPSGLAVSGVDHDSATLSWTDNAADEAGYRVYQRLAGGTWSEVADLSPDTTTYTATSLLNGRDYEWYVEAYTSDETAQSTTVTATAVLPDVDALSLDASVEDELTAHPETTPALNHGDWRVEYRETGAASWTVWGTADYTATPTITGLLDGEKYDVRVRSETADVTGAWYDASEVTLLPAPSGLTAPTVSDTSLSLSWTDNADNELEQDIRRRRTDYATAAWGVVATVATDVESYTDDSVQPGRTYEYVIRTETEHVYADSSAATVTTTAAGVPQTRTRRSRWHVEITLPTGEVQRPAVVGTPQLQPGDPQGDIMPRLAIPVSDRPRWQQAETLVDDATTVRAWYDGAQLPIDEVVAVEPEPGQVTLQCRGASQLDRYVETLQIDEQDTHLAMQDFVAAETDYATDIDDPSASTRSDVQMLAEGEGRPDDFREALAIDWPSDSATPTDDTIPLILDTNGGLRTRQTCFAYEAEDASGTYVGPFIGSDFTEYDGEWSSGQAIRLSDEGDSVGVNPSFEYTAPGIEIRFVIAVVDGDAPGIDVVVDGANAESLNVGALNTDADKFDTRQYLVSFAGDTSGTVNIDLEVRETTSNTGDIYVDAISVADGRFNYDFYASPELAGRSDPDAPAPGPQRHPEAYDVETIDVSSVEQVVGGRLEAVVDSTANGQALAVSNDQGATWKSGANTTDFEATFDSAEQQIRGRLTLSRHGTNSTALPTEGREPTRVESFTLSADLEDTPVLLDKQYSGPVGQILSEMADSGDFVLQARRDTAAAWDDPAGVTIEGTVAGQRTRDRVPDQVVDYSGATTVEGSYDKIIVKGVSRDVEAESFTANTAGNLEGLEESWIIPATETVSDPSDGTEFDRGDDYLVDWAEGAIKITSDGAMSSGTTYEIEYRWRVRGSASTPGVSNPTTQEADIPDATSQRECEQLALAILKRVQDPLREAEVTVATSDPTVSLIAAFAYDELPFDESEQLVLRGGMTVEPGRVTQRLGTRQSVGDVIEEIQSQFRAVADRV